MENNMNVVDVVLFMGQCNIEGRYDKYDTIRGA